MKTSLNDTSSPGNGVHETRTAHPDNPLHLILRVYAKYCLAAWQPHHLLI